MVKSEAQSFLNQDDTAVNAIKLYCSSEKTDGILPNSNRETITSDVGPWGSYSLYQHCKNGFYRGLKIRDSGVAWKEKLGITQIQLLCGEDWHASAGVNYGIWSEAEYCPTNSAICGISTSVQPHQGGGFAILVNDDLSLDQVCMT